MQVEFYKYHGNGNDFILIDNRRGFLSLLSSKSISVMCHRRFGIGADGLILLNDNKDYDFEMRYYNSDGNESTMCGNGGRCMIKFASHLGIIENNAKFLAIDGPHEGFIAKDGIVHLKMNDVLSVKTAADDFIINTGSPHYVTFKDKVDELNVAVEGRKIRNQREFSKEGINVNFVEMNNGKLKVRTYERGVEDETLSCGTGIVASAIAASVKSEKTNGNYEMHLTTPGGLFSVSFRGDGNSFSEIWLIGNAQLVFKGAVEM